MLSPERKKFKAKKISALIGLCLLFIIMGCGSNGDENNTSPSTAKSITAFSLNGVDGTINQTDKTIDVTLPTGTDVTALVATFTTTGASVEANSTVQISDTTANNFTDPVVYTVTAIDASTQDYTVTVTVVGKSITFFSLNGSQGAIDQTAKTITVTMPTGTDVTALVATFTQTGVSVKVGSTVQVSGTTANNFTSPVVYTVTGIDATTQDYTVTVSTEPVNKLATAVKVSMTPNTPAPHVGIYCTATSSITGSYTVTDPDGGSVITTQWYDEYGGVRTLRQTNTITLPSGVTSGTETLPRPFLYHHYITFTVIADGVVSDSVTNRIL